MKRNLTLIFSAVLVFVLLGIWIYLVFFSDRSGNNSDGVIEGSGEFTDFGGLGGDGINIGSDETAGLNNDTSDFDLVDESLDILRQLTTRNVAGYQEIVVASSTYVLFMETGVGHIYQVDVLTGDEERVTFTTIPNTRQAAFSPDGETVVVKTGDHTGINPISIGFIDRESKEVTLSPLAEMVDSFSVTADNVLLYTSVTNNSVSALSYDIETERTSALFTVPFRVATVQFGATVDGPHYFYPKTNAVLEGFVYKFADGSYTRLPIDGFGLAAHVSNDMVVATHRQQTAVDSILYVSETDEITELASPMIPDKCVSFDSNMYCAVPTDHNLRFDSITNRLQGRILFSDALQLLVGDTFVELIDIKDFSGRNVDVMNGVISQQSGDWYFQNKRDNTLWIYELSILTETEEDIMENPDTPINETSI